MKNYTSSLLRATFIIAAVISISSCMSSNADDSKYVAEEKNEQKFEDKNEEDAHFLVEAAEISREGISLGKLAQQKGNSIHVKALGKMMYDEHTESLADLTELAKTKNISLPISQTENGKDAYNILINKSGNDFGKEYSSMMVDKHRKAIDLFENAATDCSDRDIRAWANETLPTLRKHLDHSLLCKKQCEKM